ncbi:TrbC family F-type conjugative pilus assembly protein [Salmonella enterica]|uniref:TrbC family F-type conjugative pilus assembly protein n=1 Tax=Salmonella enterica TaxID=28901 RepID=UPI000BE28474|nr:TrbC family F-type conjugative pilus assembly protein [Salmonella enterica]PDN26472.1 conjugal transfer protein TraW [Salmonella enterica]
MIRSLAAHIPCSKSVLVALMFSVAGGAYAQETPLTEQDKALIEQGKQIAQKAQKMEMPSLLQNQHMDEAQAEAKAFFKQLQTTNPTLKEMHRKQAEKGIYSDHRILVFASLSLGEQGLDDVLTAVSGQPDSVIVFRGIPEGMNLGQGVKAIQALAAKKDPVPNIIINPTLFKTYNITAVPTIVMLEDEPLPGEQPNVVAQVSGLSDPVWLAREVDNGEKGDLGVKGPVEKISEPDLIDVAKKRLANIDWEEKKKQAIERFWTKQNFNELPRAPKSRTREIDPSVMITSDISTPDGTVFAHAGDVINPLCDPKEVCKPGTRPFTQAVVVFDPLDKKQMELLAKKLPEIKLEPGVQRITYIATEFDKDKGWDSYKSVTDNFDAPVYLLTPDLITRFELEHTPSVITARGKKFVVRELAEEGGE